MTQSDDLHRSDISAEEIAAQCNVYLKRSKNNDIAKHLHIPLKICAAYLHLNEEQLASYHFQQDNCLAENVNF